MKLNLKDIEAKAKFYSQELWGLDYDLPIEINSRFRNTLGCLRYKDRKTAKQIELSKYMFENEYNELTIDDVLVHELCHWALWKMNKRNDDGCNEFESELKRIGASSTRTIDVIGRFHYCKCARCGKKLGNKRTKEQATKLCDTIYYVSSCCQALLVYGGEITYEDKSKVSDKIIDLNIKYKLSYYNKVS